MTRSVAEALHHVLATVSPFPVDEIPLPAALGLRLAADIASDVDSPPFDKALMDGYAVRSVDLHQGDCDFEVIEEVTAGRVPQRALAAHQATRIMTGAPIPQGADVVIRVEDSESHGSQVTLKIARVPRPGLSVLRQGESLRKGELVLKSGTVLQPQHLGGFAELGKFQVPIRRRPKIAVLATGDELVPIEAIPGPGQIRNSNELMLIAQSRNAGAEPVGLGIARDNRDDLRQKIALGLQADVFVLSGGVSAGKLDLVPSELAAAGVREVFHKVEMKPGKPLWFGLWEIPPTDRLPVNSSTGTRRCVVFGLPGNPVSSMVCFELFVRPAIRRLMGTERSEPTSISARLAAEFRMKGDRPTYHPAILSQTNGEATVRTVTWQGSADLRATLEGNSMILFPAGERVFSVGEMVEVFPWT